MEKWLDLVGSSAERAPWGWGVLIVIIGALIKVWPIIQLQVANAKQQLRKERHDDLHDCRERLDEMSEKLGDVYDRMHKLDIQLRSYITAYKIVDAELRLVSPTSTALVQAHAALTVAYEITRTPADLAETLNQVP